MPPLTFLDATDLVQWAGRRVAQERLPQLIGRLVHASVDRIQRNSFRSGEGVQLGGWDGVVVVDQGNDFVPDGTSGWESTTTEDAWEKAEEDYRKRTADPGPISPPESTFVFVTLRRWGRIREWEEARRKERVWRDVRAYDADDLQQWLLLAPAVHLWVSELYGKHPQDAVDLDSYWNSWTASARILVPPEFVVAGRAGTVTSIHSWLSKAPGILPLKAASPEEACLILAASLQHLPEDQREAQLSRALLVRSAPAWNALAVSEHALLLVPAFPAGPEVIGRAILNGHWIVLPLGPSDASSGQTVEAPRLARDAAAAALVTAGIPEQQAVELAALARSSFMSFWRKVAISSEANQPAWATSAEGLGLLPALLAGSWNDSAEGDRKAASRLAGMPYEEWIAVLVRWSHAADPPIRRIGDVWTVVSKEDLWLLISRYLTRDVLDRFTSVVVDVLGTPDPRYDIPVDERWLAPIRDAVPQQSRVFREGLADTVALLGALGEAISVGSGLTASGYARRIIRELLERANRDWRIWASLSSWLPRFAEAEPDTFLSLVNAGVSGDEPVLRNLFADGEDPLFAESLHTGLLWAMETLAWNPNYISAATMSLAKLAKLDPRGVSGNRPLSSLRAIFHLWFPQTTVALGRRLEVLDTLRHRHSDVAWPLLLGLLPERLSIGHPTAKPRWRNWAPEQVRPTSDEESDSMAHEVAICLLADVGEGPSRWEDLLNVLPRLPEGEQAEALNRLVAVDVAGLNPATRTVIWHAVRKLLSRHRSFPDAPDALSSARLDVLELIFRRFEPSDQVERSSWLFSQGAVLPEGHKADWEAHEKALHTARLDAVQTIYARGGLAGVLELARQVEEAGHLGLTLGESDLVFPEENDLLREHLAAEDPARAMFARGFVGGRVRGHGREWAEQKLTRTSAEWLPQQRAEFLFALPNNLRPWMLLQDSERETERRYWRLMYPYGIPRSDVELAVRKFLEYDRPYAAIELLAARVEDTDAPPPVELIARALERILFPTADDDQTSSTSLHNVEELLDVLVRAEAIDKARVAALEWNFLTVLSPLARRPKLLHRRLAGDPAFFAEVVTRVYRAEGEKPRDLAPEEVAVWRRAYQLLDSWRLVPGTPADGSRVDGDVLRQWVQRARELAKANGRLAAADHIIGQVLSAAPPDSDGTWPPKAIRDAIEGVESHDLENGFLLGVLGSRGTIHKAATEGGAQEQALADRYKASAERIVDNAPKTAAVLRRIADAYKTDAMREDQRAQLRQDLYGW